MFCFSSNGGTRGRTTWNLTTPGELFTATKTIYCAPESQGTGAGNSAANAMELSAALLLIRRLVSTNFSGISLSLAAGTYTGNYVVDFRAMAGSYFANIVFSGAGVDQTIFQPTSGVAVVVRGIASSSLINVPVYFRAMTFNTTVSNSRAIEILYGAYVIIDRAIKFILGTSYAINCSYYSYLQMQSNVTTSPYVDLTIEAQSEGASSTYFIYVSQFSHVQVRYWRIVLVNTPNFSGGFIGKAYIVGLYWANTTLSGSATGNRISGSPTFGDYHASTAIPGNARLAGVGLNVAELQSSATANRVLRVGTAETNPVWGQVALTTDVSGILPVENGGTGSANDILLLKKLSSNLSLYVNVGTGDDLTADGTSGKPFKTIQACVNFISKVYYLGVYNITVNVAAGTYDEQMTLPYYNTTSGSIVIVGATTATTIIKPSTYRINNTIHCPYSYYIFDKVTVYNYPAETVGSMAFCFLSQGSGIIELRNFKAVMVSNSYGYVFGADSLGTLRIGDYSSVKAYTQSAEINSTVAYGHFYSGAGGILHIRNNIALSGTVTTATAATSAGIIVCYSSSPPAVSGTVTGKRYLATMNGSIHVNGGGANVFPGSIAGSLDSGGQYL
jgi:hypothetical protein